MATSSAAAQDSLPQLHWSLRNYPSWKDRIETHLKNHNLLYTCQLTFYDIAASQPIPWTEQRRSEVKRQFEPDYKLTLALLKKALCPKLALEIKSLKDTTIYKSAKKLVGYLAKRYQEELPAIRAKLAARWANWSLKPTGGLVIVALTTVARLTPASRKGKAGIVERNIFLDGFNKLEDIWWDCYKHGNKISHKDFIDKYLNGMAQVTDKNKGKQLYISAVASLLWAKKKPRVEQVKAVIERVRV